MFSGASVAVDGGGVAALWQADRKMMRRRNGVIFFIGYIVSSLRGRCAKRSARSNPLELRENGEYHAENRDHLLCGLTLHQSGREPGGRITKEL